MKTILIPVIVFTLIVPSFGEQYEIADKPANISSRAAAAATIDREGRKELRVITRTGETALLKLENDPSEDAGPKSWLGVVLNEVPSAVASQLPIDSGTGLIVEYVTPNSPAANAGLQKHDVLVRLADQVLIAPKQFQTLIATRKAGDTVEVAFLRKGQPQTATATVATHQPGDGIGDHRAALNLYDTKVDLERLMRDASDMTGSIIMNKKTVFVGPDGKPITIDSDEIRERTLTMLKQSGLAQEVIEQVRRAISEAQEQVRKVQEQGKRAAEQVRATKQKQAAAERPPEDIQPKR
jgi:hypothetical protein